MGKDCKQIAMVLAIVIGVCPLAPAEPPAKPKREKIGEVLGKPVYRDELRPKYPFPTEEAELHRLFLDPVLEKYTAAHRAELEPTEAELAAVEALLEKRSKPKPVATTEDILRSLQQVNEELSKKRSEFPRAYLEECKRNAEGMLRGDIPVPMSESSQPLRLAGYDDPMMNITARWAQQLKLPLIERVSQTYEKWSRKRDPAHPHRMTATFLYGDWKLQRHFYDRFGGGRVLWQQFGYEAFDAYRRWLESEEQKGNFKITDAGLRQAFYRYWRSSNAPFLMTDPSRIRAEFLEPDWVPRPAAH